MTRNRDIARAIGKVSDTGETIADTGVSFTPQLSPSQVDSIGSGSIGEAGAVTYDKNTDTIYFSNGNGLIPINGTNAAPTLDSVEFPDGTAFLHPTDSVTSTLRAVIRATDSDGTPLIYGYFDSSDGNLFTVSGVNKNTVTLSRIDTPSVDSSGNVSFSVTDGVANRVISGKFAFTLEERTFGVSVRQATGVVSPQGGSLYSHQATFRPPVNPTYDWVGAISLPASIQMRSMIARGLNDSVIASVEMPFVETYTNSSGDTNYYLASSEGNGQLTFVARNHSNSSRPTAFISNGTVSTDTSTNHVIINGNGLFDSFGSGGMIKLEIHSSTVAAAAAGNRTFTKTFTKSDF